MYPFFLSFLLVILSLGPTSPDQSPTRSAEPSDGVEIAINARLIAGEAMMDPCKLLFEITSQRLIPKAILTIAVSGRRYQTAIRLARSQTVEFTMPDIPWPERISYQLSLPDGRSIRNGELRLGELMAMSSFTVSDIRADRSTYKAGDKAQVTFLLAGDPQQPLRLEVIGRDASGNQFFFDRRRLAADRRELTEEFSIELPVDAPSPLKLDFQLFNDETGKLFDSGELEFPLVKNR